LLEQAQANAATEATMEAEIIAEFPFLKVMKTPR
jgi:hypothetical protein